MQCDGDKEIFHKWILWKEEADKSVPEQFKTKKLPECHYSGEMMSTRSERSLFCQCYSVLMCITGPI